MKFPKLFMLLLLSCLFLAFMTESAKSQTTRGTWNDVDQGSDGPTFHITLPCGDSTTDDVSPWIECGQLDYKDLRIRYKYNAPATDSAYIIVQTSPEQSNLNLLMDSDTSAQIKGSSTPVAGEFTVSASSWAHNLRIKIKNQHCRKSDTIELTLYGANGAKILSPKKNYYQ